MNGKRVVHGNTLTAAVVVENVRASALETAATAHGNLGKKTTGGAREEEGETPCVFLTGATSKVWAGGGVTVPWKAMDEMHMIVCCRQCGFDGVDRSGGESVYSGNASTSRAIKSLKKAPRGARDEHL